jgi:hypothetical protein
MAATAAEAVAGAVAAEAAITAAGATAAEAAITGAVVAAASALGWAAVVGGGVAAVAAAGAEATGAGATATGSGVVDGDKEKLRFAPTCINRLRPYVSKRGLGNRPPAQCAVRRGLGLGPDALRLGFSSAEGLPIRLRTASRTLARPFACILSLSAAMMLMTSFGALPSVATSI